MEVLDGVYTELAVEVLTDVLLKATVLLGAAWLATTLLRRASAAFRFGVWSLALSGLLIMPLMSVLLPSWQMDVPARVLEAPLPVLSEAISSAPVSSVPDLSLVSPTAPPSGGATPESGVEEHVPAAEHPMTPAEWELARVVPGALEGMVVAQMPTAEQPPVPLLTWALLVWLVGVVALLGWLLVDVARVWSMARHARLAPEGFHALLSTPLTQPLQPQRRVRILYSDRISMPMMWGLWRPDVLLPTAAQTWSEERLRLVLLHELAHVKRGDYLTHLVTQLVWSLYWPNPLAWVAARRVALEQERACDDLVLRAGTRAHTYAEHLLDLTRSLQGRVGWRGTMAMAKKSTLKERIRAILNTQSNRRALTVRTGLASTLIVAGLLLPLAALHLEKEPNDDEVDIARVDQMIEALQAGAPDVRQQAAWSLGEQESPLAVNALIERLWDPDSGVRSMAAWALGEIKDPRAVAPLIDALPDSDPYVKEMVIRALGEIEDERAVEALGQMFDENEASLRAAAAWALGEIKGPRAVHMLALVLKSDPETAPRQAAVEALKRSGSLVAIQALTAALQDNDPMVRQAAILALVQVRAPQAVEPLIVMLQRDPVAEVRRLGAVALGEFGNPRAVEGLLVGLKDPHPFVRERSAWALGRIGDPQAVGALIQTLRDPDPGVRARVVWALDEISIS